MSAEFMSCKFAQAMGVEKKSLNQQIAEDKKYLIEQCSFRESDFMFLLSGFVPKHVAAMALRKAVSFHKVQKGEMS